MILVIRQTIKPILYEISPRLHMIMNWRQNLHSKFESARVSEIVKIQWILLNLRDSHWFNSNSRVLSIKRPIRTKGIEDRRHVLRSYWLPDGSRNCNAQCDTAFTAVNVYENSRKVDRHQSLKRIWDSFSNEQIFHNTNKATFQGKQSPSY